MRPISPSVIILLPPAAWPLLLLLLCCCAPIIATALMLLPLLSKTLSEEGWTETNDYHYIVQYCCSMLVTCTTY